MVVERRKTGRRSGTSAAAPAAEFVRRGKRQKKHGKKRRSRTFSLDGGDQTTPRCTSIYHKLATSALEDVELAPAQARRIEKVVAIRQQPTKGSIVEATPSSAGAYARPAAAKGRGCSSKHLSHRNGMSKKDLINTTRTVVLLNAVKRLRDRTLAASTTVQLEGGNDHHTSINSINDRDVLSDLASSHSAVADPSLRGSSRAASSRQWKHIKKIGVREVAGAADKPEKEATDIVGNCLNLSSIGPGAPRTLKSDPWRQACSLTPPLLTLGKLVSIIDDINNCSSDNSFSHPAEGDDRSSDVLSDLSKATVTDPERVEKAFHPGNIGGGRGLDQDDTRRGRRASAISLSPFNCSHFEEGDPCGGRVGSDDGEGGRSAVRLSDVSLGDLAKVDESLSVLREKAALSLPRHSHNRATVALARIDSILFALVDENLGASRGGGRSQGGGPVGATMLSHEEVEAVIAYVDMDQSGEIDAEELMVAISAAKQGKMSDEGLAACMMKIDDELRLRHLRICDVFTMLDTDGSGTLSRLELAEGLSVLCGHDRLKIIQRRQVLRRRKQEQQEEEERKRDAVAGFLTNMESLPENTLQDREYFATDVTNEGAFNDLVQRISDQAGYEDLEDSVCFKRQNSRDGILDPGFSDRDNDCGPTVPRQKLRQHSSIQSRDANLYHVTEKSFLRQKAPAGSAAAAVADASTKTPPKRLLNTSEASLREDTSGTEKRRTQGIGCNGLGHGGYRDDGYHVDGYNSSDGRCGGGVVCSSESGPGHGGRCVAPEIEGERGTCIAITVEGLEDPHRSADRLGSADGSACDSVDAVTQSAGQRLAVDRLEGRRAYEEVACCTCRDDESRDSQRNGTLIVRADNDSTRTRHSEHCPYHADRTRVMSSSKNFRTDPMNSGEHDAHGGGSRRGRFEDCSYDVDRSSGRESGHSSGGGGIGSGLDRDCDAADNDNKSRRSAAMKVAAAEVAKMAIRARSRHTPYLGSGQGKIDLSSWCLLPSVISSVRHPPPPPPPSCRSSGSLATAGHFGSSQQSCRRGGEATGGVGRKSGIDLGAELGEDVVGRQKKYDLHDKFLRTYLQRQFERERLPLLFAARSKSRLHGYTINSAFDMARKQAARMPSLL